MAEKLTPQQKMAVENRGGRLLVSAAAGSGKTKVLVDRLMLYLTDPVAPANIDDFLLITYTKAAASELRGKIAAKLSERIAQMPDNRHLQRQLQRLYLTKISTVHSFCGDLLREYAYQLNIPGDFRVGDENECAELRFAAVERVLNEAYDHAAENEDFCAFVDSQGVGRNDAQVPELILKVFDSARCHLDPHKWLDECLALMTVQELSDASETPFGEFLIDRLHRWLQLHIQAVERAIAMAREQEKMEKVIALLTDLLFQLERLRESKTWDAIVDCANVDFGRMIIPKSCDPEVAETIKAVRNACKKGLEKQLRPFTDRSAQILSDLKGCLQAAKGLVGLVLELEKAYDQAKRARRILDFGDLEHRTLDLLLGKSRSGITAAAHEIGSRFREIMVDEYQDSNEVQDAIYDALSRKNQDLFMVGDVKQSIYQFRLADPGIFLHKYNTFLPAEKAEPGQDRKVVLSQNFRSSGGVLSAANAVFSCCMTPEVGGLVYGEAEALYEGLEHVPLGSAEAELYCVDVQEDSYPEEAAFVAGKIRQMLEEETPVRDGDRLRPVRAEDIVILLRSPNSCGHYFQRALEQQGIRCASGGVDLLQTEEIGDLRSLLQAIYNPRLDIPLIGAMASPVFGFTADDLGRIRGRKKQCCIYESLQACQLEKAKDFLNILQQLRSVMRRQSLTGLLEEIWLLTGMDDLYAAMEGGQARRENLQLFFQLAAEFEGNGNGDLGRFLEYLEHMEEKGLITSQEGGNGGAVTVMSVHKSKGLEFPVVFLSCLGREFNMESQRANILCHKDMGLGLSVADRKHRLRYPSVAKRAIAAKIGEESVSEEMRVLYVAMTRPKDRLIMTYASKRLEKELAETVQRIRSGSRELLIREAICPGDWVLLTALGRTEAGELFALGGNPGIAKASSPEWKIRVVRAGESGVFAVAEEKQLLDALQLERIGRGLAYRYGHIAATSAPSKQTATQRKGRDKDAEAAEHTPAPHSQERLWRKADFAQAAPGGKDYGNATHQAMQYIDYAACREESGVRAELERLVQQKYLTAGQAKLVDPRHIAAFFATDLGKKLCAGAPCIREFKFSILEDGYAYDPALAGEQVLLQGVVDCALIEPDGITVIDFKTDRVTEDTLDGLVARYRPQVQAYADALSRIYQMQVKETLLYFFRLDRFARV